MSEEIIEGVKARNLWDIAGCIFVLIDKNKKVVFINKRGCEILGYSKDEIIGKNWFENFLPSEFKEKVEDVFKRLVKGEIKESEYFENPVLTKNGEKRSILWHNTVLKNKNGEISATLSSGIDITGRKELEKSLRDALQKVEIFANAIRDAIVVVNDKGEVDFWNDAAEKIFGYKKEEAIGKGLHKLIIPSRYLESYQRAIRKFKFTGKGQAIGKIMELSALTKGKTEIPIELSLSSFQIEEKWYAIGIARDISERKKMGEKLKNYQKKLKELHQTVHLLQKCKSEKEIAQNAIQQVEKILGFNFCVLYLVKENFFYPVAFSPAITFYLKLKPLSLNKGILGKTLEKEQTFWGRTKTHINSGIKKAIFKSFISTPVDKVGVLQVYLIDLSSFNEEDVELLEILAEHLAEEIKKKRLEERLKYLALHDPLTGTYNRYYSREILEREIKRAKRCGSPLGFLMIDINRFKEINDRYSHLTGDRILQEVARLIMKSIRNTDIVIRFGGDEFLVLLPETGRETDEIKKRIREKIENWNRNSTPLDFPLTLAIGAAFWDPAMKKEVKDVLKEADLKMYLEKRLNSGKTH